MWRKKTQLRLPVNLKTQKVISKSEKKLCRSEAQFLRNPNSECERISVLLLLLEQTHVWFLLIDTPPNWFSSNCWRQHESAPHWHFNKSYFIFSLVTEDKAGTNKKIIIIVLGPRIFFYTVQFFSLMFIWFVDLR